MSDLNLTPRALSYTTEICEQSPDSRIDTSLEWFSPVAEKRRGLWRQRLSSQTRRTKSVRGSEVESSDLQAGLAKAILMLKDEVARNSSQQETAHKELEYFVTELLQCKDDLTLALHSFNGIFAVIRRKILRGQDLLMPCCESDFTSHASAKPTHTSDAAKGESDFTSLLQVFFIII
jgi:hypothetical protein